MSRRPSSLLLAVFSTLAAIVYAAAVVASGAGAVPTGGPLTDDVIDHSEQVGAPHAPRHENASVGVVSRQRDGRTPFAGTPATSLPPAALTSLALLSPDVVGQRFAFESERSQASIACTSHRTSRGPPAFGA